MQHSRSITSVPKNMAVVKLILRVLVVNVKGKGSAGTREGGGTKNESNAPGRFVSNEDSGYSSLSTNDSREEQSSSLNDWSGSFGTT